MILLRNWLFLLMLLLTASTLRAEEIDELNAVIIQAHENDGTPTADTPRPTRSESEDGSFWTTPSDADLDAFAEAFKNTEDTGVNPFARQESIWNQQDLKKSVAEAKRRNYGQIYWIEIPELGIRIGLVTPPADAPEGAPAYALVPQSIARAAAPEADESWTAWGRPPTPSDYRTIHENILLLLALDAESGYPLRTISTALLADGSITSPKQFWPLGYSPWNIVTHNAIDFDYVESVRGTYYSFPLTYAEGGGYSYYPGPYATATTYSAPAPWVIHLTPPTIRYETTNPWYAYEDRGYFTTGPGIPVYAAPFPIGPHAYGYPGYYRRSGFGFSFSYEDDNDDFRIRIGHHDDDEDHPSCYGALPYGIYLPLDDGGHVIRRRRPGIYLYDSPHRFPIPHLYTDTGFTGVLNPTDRYSGTALIPTIGGNPTVIRYRIARPWEE